MLLESHHHKILCELCLVTQRSQGHWGIKKGGRLVPPFSFTLNISWGFQLKHQVKLGGQTKALICALLLQIYVTPACVSLRKTSGLSAHFARALAQGCTDFIRGPDEGLAIMLRIRRQEAGGGGVSCWTMGGWGNTLREACCWREH